MIQTKKQTTFKNCAPFTDCISEINDTQLDCVKDLDILIRMYIWIEYSKNYDKTSGSLWQYCRDESDDIYITLYDSFKCKSKLINEMVMWAL